MSASRFGLRSTSVRRSGIVAQTEAKLLRNLHRLDHHELAHRALLQELDAAPDFCKQRVVLAAAAVQSRFHTRAALPHANSPARNDLSPKRLESRPLCVRIA